jgi:ubiquinone/menaquinone biosynthesis C-methylase UbiE
VQQWQRADEAAAWDAGGSECLPTRAEQQELLLALLEGSRIGDGAVLDLGIGTGLVAEVVLEMFREVQLVGVDFSPAMLDLACERLRRFGSRVQLRNGDLSTPEAIELPPGSYRAAFSIQTLHHLDDREKADAIGWMARHVEPEGLVVVIDRVRVEEALFDDWQVAWRRIDPSSSGTYAEHVAELTAAGDRPAALEDHLAWMKEADLTASCLHLYGNRALLVARKPG